MQKSIEQRSLTVNFIITFIVSVAGIIVYFVTDIQALLLDGFFSFISFLSAMVGIYISRISHKKTTRYPHGLHFLEPLYAIFKSILILLLLLLAFINASETALHYFLAGEGEPLLVGPILPYTLFVVTLCFALSFYNHYQNRKINFLSTILKAETKGSMIDGLQSLGAGLAFCLLYFIDLNGTFGFLHYTADFFITSISVICLLPEPVKMLHVAFIELSHGLTTDQEITEPIDDLILQHFKHVLPHINYQIVKIGMALSVKIYVENHDAELLLRILSIRPHFLEELQALYPNARASIIYI
ncbi:cation transporter [Streptococcus sp. zg-86]|uniref:Cation transporter n=1 Tax=Streptococcus zhangguiae TaxID=2664091 RepID=A0A6I4RSI4_9STRE|nr:MULTISPECIES: cation transporter [unclassified Streptococcus]MTB63790.1 cation transporter [Streptococcus sp. zg-86]MTB90100.1 cation transporter [Streptococcus sp. zg-36]MWV55772.1 cation transporter [Streptococcus sp. zg-70]QTH47942.1 cation transporter [Streptococcus sp. zg-86]